VPHAHVSLQGSVRRATGVFSISDVDFIVEKCKVSSEQRTAIALLVRNALCLQYPEASYQVAFKTEVMSLKPAANGDKYMAIDIAFERCANLTPCNACQMLSPPVPDAKPAGGWQVFVAYLSNSQDSNTGTTSLEPCKSPVMLPTAAPISIPADGFPHNLGSGKDEIEFSDTTRLQVQCTKYNQSYD
jgi:hypothetical protein